MKNFDYNKQFTEEELATEIWKDIPNYEGLYQVSNLGRVKSFKKIIKYYKNGKEIIIVKKEKILRLNKGNANRIRTNLRNINSVRTFHVHTLVIETFICPRPEGMECCHNDGNPTNNRLSNLRWDTHKNNMADMIKHGTYQYGEKNPHTKFSTKDIERFRILGNSRNCSIRKLAKSLGISHCHLSDILNNKFRVKG